MATAIDWPAQVVTAAALKFKTPVGAILWLPVIEYPCLVGRVYMDLRGRFSDGRLIRTSSVMALIEERGYTIARTFSGSYYLLVQMEGNACAGFKRLPGANSFPLGSLH